MHSKTLFSAAASLTGCMLSLALIASPAQARKVKTERGLEPAHQPEVSRTDFVFDVAGSGNGELSPAETRRLKAWFDALGLRFGDHVTLAGAGTRGLAGVRDSVAELVAGYGLLTEGEAPVTAGDPPAGSLRVVVSRSTAAVQSCPNWSDRSQTNLTNSQGANYGCAIATNLAAMVADPQDLVQGRNTDTDLRTATGSRAIRTYQDKAPTGAGGLQIMSAGGK
ncbi:MAG: pilus assembly protein CpaD [Sphingobium sp.]|nr:pilus assembly protein CpaD [Sphingobium sp.]